MADISPELYTIRSIGDDDAEDRKYYAKELVKSKLTPESNLKFRVLEEQTIGRRKKSLLKFEGIEKEEWVNNRSIRFE